MKVAFSQSKQSTLDILPLQFNIPKTNEASKPIKEIIIKDIVYVAKEDELAL